MTIDEIDYKDAMKIIIRELRKDTDSMDSMYYVWQANIAMTIMDNSNIDRENAGMIAKKFLDMLLWHQRPTDLAADSIHLPTYSIERKT